VIKLRKPWLIRPAGTIAANFVRVLMGTVRQRISLCGDEPMPPPADSEPFIYVFWHEYSLLFTPFKANVHVLASLHADGELMTRICRNLGLNVIRGSTTRGGTKALLGLLRREGGSHVVLTPDGPVGPRRRSKMGPVALAAMSGMPIVPIGVGCSAAWRAGSWDRMMVPCPWSTAHYVTGPSIRVPAGLDRAGMNRYSQQIEESLGVAVAVAERWAAGGPKPIRATRSRLAACA
jgi:lysophospholipid acyltransferase (LPLAT)-like uncharacterized protein